MAPKPPRREPLSGATAGETVLAGPIGLIAILAFLGADFGVFALFVVLQHGRH